MNLNINFGGFFIIQILLLVLYYGNVLSLPILLVYLPIIIIILSLLFILIIILISMLIYWVNG